MLPRSRPLHSHAVMSVDSANYMVYHHLNTDREIRRAPWQSWAVKKEVMKLGVEADWTEAVGLALSGKGRCFGLVRRFTSDCNHHTYPAAERLQTAEANYA